MKLYGYPCALDLNIDSIIPKNKANIPSPTTSMTRRFLISPFPFPASISKIIPIVIAAPTKKAMI